MNGDEAGTGLPPPAADAPHLTGRKKKSAGGNELVRRLNASRDRAKSLARVKQRVLPIRIGVTINVHELLCDLAEANHTAVTVIAKRCLLDGLTRYAKVSLKRVVDTDSFGMFDRNEVLRDAHYSYGEGEGRARQQIDEEVERARNEAHAAAAADVGIRTRRNAAAPS